MSLVNSPADARDVLCALVKTTWDNNTSAPLSYDNLQIENRPAPPAPFGRVVVRHVPTGGRVFLGKDALRYFGVLYVQLFTPRGTGMAELDALAKALVVALTTASSADLQGIRIRDIGLVELNIDPGDRAYFQVNVQAFFDYDTFN